MTPKSDNGSSRTSLGRKAVFPGSFNPFTLGHLDIVRRALRIFDSVVVAIGVNSAKPDEDTLRRLEEIKAIFKGDEAVEVAAYDTLTADFVKRCGASCIIRGVRSTIDFEYEKSLSDANLEVLGVDTLFLPCRPSLAYVSSSLVRELSRYGMDTSALLPEAASEP